MIRNGQSYYHSRDVSGKLQFFPLSFKLYKTFKMDIKNTAINMILVHLTDHFNDPFNAWSIICRFWRKYWVIRWIYCELVKDNHAYSIPVTWKSVNYSVQILENNIILLTIINDLTWNLDGQINFVFQELR